MKKEPLFELCAEDDLLFKQMEGHYQPKEEQMFFETMRYKEMYEPAYSNEELILREENEEKVDIIRCSECEYEFGSGEYGNATALYVCSLADMLNTNLLEVGITSMKGTMLDWLRARNYKGIRYDRNIALM